MISKDIQALVEKAYPNMMERLGQGNSAEYRLTLEKGDTIYIKFTTIFINTEGNKQPLNQTRFTKIDKFDPNCRYFILAGDSDSFNLENTLKNALQDINCDDDYIIAIEPKNGFNPQAEAKKKPNYTLSFTNRDSIIAKIRADKSQIGIYRTEVNAPHAADYNSFFAVFIKVKENDKPTDLYLKRYFAAADQRSYRNVVYTISAVQNIDSVHIPAAKNTVWPKNLLIFGAPGTGKSFAIDKKLANLGWNKYAQRVTFYEDYSYEKFVGSYIPKKSVKKSEINGNIDSQTLCLESAGEGITYEFVPGPFLEMAADAWLENFPTIAIASKKSQKTDSADPTDNAQSSSNGEVAISPRILVIEEINRANAASVFGDMFQLLDRNKDGISEYGITLAPEMKEWLIQYLNKNLQKKELPGTLKDAENFANNFKLPSNFYIWATMNSADQGVFPLDSAFKRRWSFLYKSVMEERTDNNKYLYTYVKDNQSPVFVSWDGLRTAINEVMCNTENNVEEDRCIGAWYFKPTEMQQIFEYTRADQPSRMSLPNPLCDKLFHYLRQDVFRNNPGAIFNEKYLSMYKLREALVNSTPLLELLNLPQDSLKNCIIPANEIEFMVETGKVDVNLDKLAEMASKASVSFDKSIVFNMNNTCHTTYTLNEADQTRLIKETLDALQKGCTSPEAFEVLCKTFKDLPDAPNGNKEPEQGSSGVDGNSPAYVPSNHATTSAATQENSQ